MGWYPLNLRDEISFRVRNSSYSLRRAGVGVAEGITPKLTDAQRNALGNWANEDMASHYAGTTLAESFKVKALIVMVVRATAQEVSRQNGGQGAWNFQWGDIPQYVPDATQLMIRAGQLSSGITEEEPSNFSRTGRTLDLPFELSAEPAPQDLPWGRSQLRKNSPTSR